LEKSNIMRTGPFERIMVYTVPGPLFFGSIDNILETIENCRSKVVILNMSRVPVIDETAATALLKYHSRIVKEGRYLLITRLQKKPHNVLMKMYGEKINEKNILFDNIEKARDYAYELLERNMELEIQPLSVN